MTRILGLLLVWLVLWRDVTPGLIVSGIVVAWLAQLLAPSSDDDHATRLRWWLLPQVAGDVLYGVAQSTVSLGRAVVTPGTTLEPAELAFHLEGATMRELSWVAIAMTLTPGTYVIDVVPGDERLDLHLVDASQAAGTADDLRRLHHDMRRVLGAPAGPTTVSWRALGEHPSTSPIHSPGPLAIHPDPRT